LCLLYAAKEQRAVRLAATVFPGFIEVSLCQNQVYL